MKTIPMKDRIRNRRRKKVRWQKPSTGSFIKDCIIGNKAAMEWLRHLAEEHENNHQLVPRQNPAKFSC